MPQGVDFAAREVMDGLSMRIVRAYDINNDKFPCRPMFCTATRLSARSSPAATTTTNPLLLAEPLRGFFTGSYRGQ